MARIGARRIGAGLLLGLGLLVVAAIALVNLRDSGVIGGASASSTPNQGRSTAFFGAIGGDFHLTVNQVRRGAEVPGAPAPGEGLGYLVLSLTYFSTATGFEERAYIPDLTLVDTQGATRRPVLLAGTQCAGWPMTDLRPARGTASVRDQEAQQAGPVFGPVNVCFAAALGGSGLLTLVWDPDVGLFGTPARILLR